MIKQYMLKLSILLSLLANAATAQDEDINDKYFPIIVLSEDDSVFALVGEIDIRASLNFKRAVNEFGVPDLLLLNSSGGLVYIGLDLALEVNRLGITTAIPEEFSCYSACSYVFLAGKERYLDGELGIHQVSSSYNDLIRGQFTIADMIDVLNSFDVPKELYPPMLSTPPNEIYVVSKEEVRKLGLDSRASDYKYRSERAPTVTYTGLERLALDFVSELQASSSGSGLTKLYDLVSNYAQTVDYYGKLYTSDQIYSDKINFFKRWPIRSYHLDNSRSSVRCDNENRCFFSGVTLWSASSPERNAKASGEAKLDFELFYSNGYFLIVKEHSVVLRRD